MINYTRNPGSFKDPSGFVFESNGILYRQVNQHYATQYERLMSSGLYHELTKQQQLVAHQEVANNITQTPGWYKTLLPTRIPVITYPYEWCFEQLRDAGLLTLQVLRSALRHGMVLKDATPFNVQFVQGKPVFIDTLSFAMYDETQPWIAYRQFCQCFLFPLYLEHYLKTGIQKITAAYPDGIPVDLTAKLLPFKSRWNAGAWLHVFLQNKVAKSNRANSPAPRFSQQKLLHLVSHLESILRGFPSGNKVRTTWSDYYSNTILSKEYLQAKETIFREMLVGLPVTTALDLGANDGHFSRVLAENNRQVIATDTDSQCINSLYSATRQHTINNILPLVVDVSNPSPAIGFHNRERSSFHERVRTDLVVALALVHHLVIGKNIPLPDLAAWLHDIAPHLIIEFVGKKDEKVQQMLKNREDIFYDYTVTGFEEAFSLWFRLVKKMGIPQTDRTLYYMKRKN